MTDARRDRAPRRLDRQARLAAYALAGGAALAATPQADADIVYTDLDPDVTIGPNNDFFFLDLDNDNTPDFPIFFYSYPPYYDVLFLYNYAGNGLVGYYNGNYFYASALAAGDLIGPGNVVVDAPLGTMSYYLTYNNANVNYGPWAGVTDRFLGLMFLINGEVHYGWARLDMTDGSPVATLKDYAYETTAGLPVLAGSLVSVPEPTSLGLLALGALGVVAHRRMRARAEANADADAGENA